MLKYFFFFEIVKKSLLTTYHCFGFSGFLYLFPYDNNSESEFGSFDLNSESDPYSFGTARRYITGPYWYGERGRIGLVQALWDGGEGGLWFNLQTERDM